MLNGSHGEFLKTIKELIPTHKINHEPLSSITITVAICVFEKTSTKRTSNKLHNYSCFAMFLH